MMIGSRDVFAQKRCWPHRYNTIPPFLVLSLFSVGYVARVDASEAEVSVSGEAMVAGGSACSDKFNGGGREESSCLDEHEMCPLLAGRGDCESNPNYMLLKCKKSCSVCGNSHVGRVDTGVEQISDKEHKAQTLDIIRRTHEYVRDTVMVKREYESVRSECKNRHRLCSFWAVLGECENSPKYMELQCAPTCRTCDKLDIKNRCPLDPNAEDALGPGDLNKLFERIITEKEIAEFKPKVLARPDLPEGVSNREDLDCKIGMPWFILFENFLTSEECDRLIELGAVEGYERSMDVGKKRFDGSYDPYESTDRTSENAVCQFECYEDPVARRVMDRISNVTGIPEPNSEYLQLLKYEVGQRYGRHHDYIPHQRERQPGVRLLTLFLYLNDVEEGGETDFPVLDITVMPKKGKAVLWPSVLDADPNAKDPRTDHEALPVIKGVKYGANAWIHMRDFKTPNRNNCH